VPESVAGDDLGLQLELGLPAEGVPLAKVLGAEIGRGDYLLLLSAGVANIDHLALLNHEALVAVVGEASAGRINGVLERYYTQTAAPRPTPAAS